MHRSHQLLAAVAGLSFAALACAQSVPPVKPGLWSVEMRTLFDGQSNETLEQQLAHYTPDQQAALRRQIEAKGVRTDGVTAVRQCITASALATPAWHGAGGPGCTSRYASQDARGWKWHSTCARADTDGEVSFQDAEHFTAALVTVAHTPQLGDQTMRSARTYRWLGAECGATP